MGLLYRVPTVHLKADLSFQMAFGKYAKSGPYGLWRAFPLGTGIGVVWIIMSFVAICQEAVQKSRAFVHLFAVILEMSQLVTEKNVQLFKCIPACEISRSMQCNAMLFFGLSSTTLKRDF